MTEPVAPDSPAQSAVQRRRLQGAPAAPFDAIAALFGTPLLTPEPDSQPVPPARAGQPPRAMPGIVESRRLASATDELAWSSRTDVARINSQQLTQADHAPSPAPQTRPDEPVTGEPASPTRDRTAPPAQAEVRPDSPRDPSEPTRAGDSVPPDAPHSSAPAPSREFPQPDAQPPGAPASVIPAAQLLDRLNPNPSGAQAPIALAASGAQEPEGALMNGALPEIGPAPGRTGEAKAASAPARAAPVPKPEIRELAGALAAAIRRGQGSVLLRLSAEKLGVLRVALQVRPGEGDVKSVIARIESASDTARQLLEESVPTLKAALEARGLRVERVEVAPVRQELPSPSHQPGQWWGPSQDGTGGQHPGPGSWSEPRRRSSSRSDEPTGDTSRGASQAEPDVAGIGARSSLLIDALA